ncbi:MAG: hypothetical protein LT106_11990 [Burkholderiaceae bacterium]|nr:hypothetical protein [Burkholderiaceae bacterium]
MSSLAVSLLLLLVVAIAIAVAYNLRQGTWPRWQQSLRRMLGRERASGNKGHADRSGRREAAAGNGRRSGEPRLDAGLEAAGDGPAVDGGEARSASQWSGGDDESGEAPAATPATIDRMRESAREERAPGPREERFSGSGGVAAGAASGASPSVPGAASAPAASAASPSPSPAPAFTSATGRAGEEGGREPAAARAGAAAAAQTSAAPASMTPASAPMAPPSAPMAPAPAPGAAPPAPAATAPVAAGPALSEACDCIIELVPASRLPGERVLAIAQRFRRAGSKPVAFDARARADDAFGPLTAGRSYDLVRVGILLANRNGPLNAMEFSEFVSAVQAIAETLPARLDAPAMGSVLARARDLDSTCAQLDVQIGVNVEAPEAVDPAQLAALAPALALVERGSHRYVRPGPQGEPLFTLAFSDSPSRLTFLLDVPRVAASLEPFARMVQTAGACAQRLGARLVDDSGKPLTQASLAQIARQLAQRYESLEAIGLPAGSTLACKVFN